MITPKFIHDLGYGDLFGALSFVISIVASFINLTFLCNTAYLLHKTGTFYMVISHNGIDIK